MKSISAIFGLSALFATSVCFANPMDAPIQLSDQSTTTQAPSGAMPSQDNSPAQSAPATQSQADDSDYD